jgi:exopolysaccharide biosynthesis polyprenyl glycosylphosphotransferase
MLQQDELTRGFEPAGPLATAEGLDLVHAPGLPGPSEPVAHRRIPVGKAWLAVTDLVAVLFGVLGAMWLGTAISDRSLTWPGDWEVAGLLTVLSMAGLAQQRPYPPRRIAMRRDEYPRVIKAVWGGIGASILVGYVLRLDVPPWALLLGATGTACVLVNREVQRQVFLRLRRGGRLQRRAIIVGGGDHATSVSEMLTTTQELGYEVVGYLDTSDRGRLGREELVAEVSRLATATRAGTVLVATSAVDHMSTGHITRRLTDNGLHVELCLPLEGVDIARLRMRPLGRFPVVYVEPVRRDGWRDMAKRTFDVVVAGFVLTLTLPLLVAAMVAVKLDSPGPVVFRQRRVGRDGVEFEVLKLRTMCIDAEQRLAEVKALNEAEGPVFKLKHDPRITRVGRILRKLSIDELPQLWNVVRGEMSVVGPRPALPSEMTAWSLDNFERLRVRPGITGMWQVHGRSDASGDAYLRLDLYYVDNWSLVMDLLIALKTVPVVITGRGAY